MKNIVILTGSGISAESGLKTFRSEDGLWLNHRVEDVCTLEAFERNPALVHSFYNELRPIMMKATPNAGHQAITMLQQELPDVTINVVTQNVDLLHEKAGSKNIYHIHGRIDECVCMNCGHVLTTLGDVESDETCPNCHVQGMLKPNIVFFGEMPKYMDEVNRMLAECDMFIAIGTSGIVYPAAGFVRQAKFYGAKTYLFNLDPCNNSSQFDQEILGKASQTFPKFAEQLVNEYKRGKIMATIHLIHGFMGFGKTTLSKELAKKYNAKHFAIDQVMLKKYGRNPKDFNKAYQECDDYIWQETEKLIQAGQDVILDYGFWDRKNRKKVQEKALKLTPNVLWHQLICDIDVAKKRVLKRTKENPDELFIDENCFNERFSRYQPITDDEGLNVEKHISE